MVAICPHCGEKLNIGKLMSTIRNKKLTKAQRVAIATKASHSTKNFKKKLSTGT